MDEASGIKIEYADDIIRVYSPYNAAFVRAIKTLPSGTRLWNNTGRYWAVDIAQEDKLMQIISRFFTVGEVADDDPESLEIPDHIRSKLWELRVLSNAT
jgi:hypothetical protein